MRGLRQTDRESVWIERKREIEIKRERETERERKIEIER